VGAAGAGVSVGVVLAAPLVVAQPASMTMPNTATNETYRPPRDTVRASGVHLSIKARSIWFISSWCRLLLIVDTLRDGSAMIP
jgi:hypothetical protein